MVEVVVSEGQPSVWHTPRVNRHHVWRAYVDSYSNHAFGILQEDGQNSFDAYPPGTDPKSMKVVVKYDADSRTLTHRDYGSLGMPHCRDCEWGIRAGGLECESTDCAWGCYHNMGYTNKGGESLGARGMGKSLQLLAGTETQVTTTLPDGRHQTSVWERESAQKDWHWRPAPERDRELSSSGTEVVTKNVVDAVHSQLSDNGAVVAELQERWFRLIEDGATVEFLLVKEGKTQRTVVRVPARPPLDDSQGADKAEQTRQTVVVTYQGKRLGELRNLHLFLAKAPFKEGDRRWGIAICKNGKQTVTRFTDLPEEIPENVRRRVFGFADAICTSDEPFLKDAENSQHTGYQWSHPTYKAARRELRDIVKDFVQPFLRAGGERVTESEQQEGREILEVFNQALAEVPEFGFFGREGIAKKRKVVVESKDYLYLSRLQFENRSYKKGERALVEAVIKNPTPKSIAVKAVFEHFDPTPVVVERAEESVLVKPGTPDGPSTAIASWRVAFDKSQASGIHWVQVALVDPGDAPFTNKEGDPIRERRHIYCEFEPKKIERSRSGTGPLKDGEGPGGGEGGYGLSGIQVFRRGDMRDSMEASVDMSQAMAFVNYSGRRLEFSRAGSKSKKSSWPLIGELIAEKMLELKASLDAGEKEVWNAEELKNKVVELESSKAKLVRKMVEILAKAA